MGALVKCILHFNWKTQTKKPLEGRSRSEVVMVIRILEKYGMRGWTGSGWGPVVGFYESGKK